MIKIDVPQFDYSAMFYNMSHERKVVKWPEQPPRMNFIAVPTYIGLDRPLVQRHLTKEEQSDFMAALQQTGKLKARLKRG